MPVTSLNVNELDRLRQRLQADVEHLVDSHNVLGRAVARSEAASKAVSTLAASQADQPLLLPLTGSLYVKGKVADTQQLLVNIGTDYYVEMTAEQTQDYCKRKTTYVQKQQQGVQKAAQERKNQLMQVTDVLQSKMASMQSGGGGGSSAVAAK